MMLLNLLNALELNVSKYSHREKLVKVIVDGAYSIGDQGVDWIISI